MRPEDADGIIGVGRFRIWGGGRGGAKVWNIKGGANFQQAHDVVLTSMRYNDVASTSFRRHVPTRFLINKCQIIAFPILKSEKYRKFKKRLEKNNFASTFKSNVFSFQGHFALFFMHCET